MILHGGEWQLMLYDYKWLLERYWTVTLRAYQGEWWMMVDDGVNLDKHEHIVSASFYDMWALTDNINYNFVHKRYAYASICMYMYVNMFGWLWLTRITHEWFLAFSNTITPTCEIHIILHHPYLLVNLGTVGKKGFRITRDNKSCRDHNGYSW